MGGFSKMCLWGAWPGAWHMVGIESAFVAPKSVSPGEPSRKLFLKGPHLSIQLCS